ncbi:MAG: type II 3-dehydroquinate dehydratase [Candidatus Accumulibacter sp.]|uniref:type II 3-dehydroquinate dehydratase n=1 Tax=Accumulibacter sp. TaxID=2053492 RepID=UPI0028798BAF|nr:type II 3-dehydroquinate dehydratase [Accumulibacter sp.]MDS4014801.1 type II 3-dehydroquinate dehydratase [Accumulibacter sp.]
MRKQKDTSSDGGEKIEQARLLVLHGPNLNLLGTREPRYYGSTTLAEINRALVQRAEGGGVVLETFQSNHEGALIERVHAAREQNIRYMIINPAAYTHTSIALRDAVAGSGIAFVEVHLSNIHARESFRHQSYFSDLAIGVVCGLGSEGYLLALEYLLRRIATE